jgi:hypothetical protein
MHGDQVLRDGNVYQIRVEGELDQSWSDWFSGVKVLTESHGGGLPITTLTGVMADQSALRGIISKIWDLNLTLVSVTRLGSDSGRAGGIRDG